jgi:hypothetical protein
VVTGVHDVPRGPDVNHRIRVERAWLERGAVIELALPRNLSCAACSGGGCDRCGRSGAISLRGRGEPAELLTVTLPRRCAEELSRDEGIVLRLPGQGGFPEPGSDLPRGLLLLRVDADQLTDPGIRLVPEASVPAIEREPSKRPSAERQPEPERTTASWVWFLVAALTAFVIILLFRAILHR